MTFSELDEDETERVPPVSSPHATFARIESGKGVLVPGLGSYTNESGTDLFLTSMKSRSASSTLESRAGFT